MLEITGYSDRISARPGETIRFMVNCERPTYRADLVCLICGDDNPDGPGFKEKVVRSTINRRHRGRRQVIDMGSYGVVEHRAALEGLESFTVAAYVWPTTPARGEQAIISKEHARDGAGFCLFIDDTGCLAFRLGTARGKGQTIRTGRPLRARAWYVVAATVDVERRRVSLVQRPIEPCVGINDERVASEALARAPVLANTEPLLFAAALAGRKAGGRLKARAHLNGRIDSPRLVRGALKPDEIETVLRAPLDARFAGRIVAAWDFSIDIPTTRLADIGPERLDGRTVNLPTRAMTGRQWDGSEHCWQRAPSHYAAVHFHDDDVYDAGWEVDFTLEVPAGLPGGLYAARLRAGESEEYIPFAVLPRRGSERKVALLLPTASYMAYANEAMGFSMSGAELMTGQLAVFSKPHLFLNEHPEYGLSLYDSHSDGSGVSYSSRLRPILNMRPKFHFQWACYGKQGSHLREFNADVTLIDWLTQAGIEHDVITDEDLHREGYAALKPYRVVITGGHPEYTSTSMREGLSAFTAGGGRLMYLGGNGFYWRIAFSDAHPGAIEVRRTEGGIRTWAALPGEYFMSFTGEYGGMWRRQGNYAPQALCGVGFTAEGFDKSSYYRRTEASFDPRVAFMFQGIGKDELIGDFGFHGDGAAGNELDRADPLLGTPANALVVAQSEKHTALYFVVNEEVLVNNPWIDGTNNPLVRADMVFYETTNGGAVFSVGSIAYNQSLAWNGYRNNVARLTGNVLKRFIDPTPF